jgi:chromosome partitioning protein
MTILLVISPKGGSGKSTLVRNLAAAAAADGLQVGTVDTDPQGTLTRWHQVRSRLDGVPTIQHYTVPLRTDVPPGQAAEVVRDAAGIKDITLVDTPTAIEAFPQAVAELITAADFIVIPTQPLPDDVVSVEAAVRLVGKKACVLYVLNKVQPRRREADTVRVRLGRSADVAAAAIPDSVDIYRAMAAGFGITEHGGRGAEEIEALWNEIGRRAGM